MLDVEDNIKDKVIAAGRDEELSTSREILLSATVAQVLKENFRGLYKMKYIINSAYLS